MKIPTYTNAMSRPAGPSGATRSPAVFLLMSLASGLIIGAITLLGQGVLPDSVVQVANSGAVWVVVAFALGHYAPSWRAAAIGGFIALVGELIGYFSAAYFAIKAESSIASMLFWFLVAVVAGPLFGYAGFVAQDGAGRAQKLANAALGAAFVGEGLYLMMILPALQTGIIWLVIATVITLILNRTTTARLEGMLITAGLGLVFFGCELLLVLFDSLRVSLFTG